MDDDDYMDNVTGLKTILVGESGTGKTCLIGALAGMAFETFSMTTSSASFIDKSIELNDVKYSLEVWDTAGQEKLRSLTKIFTKDSKIVIFVYDITDKKSFDEMSFWVNMIKESLGEKPVLGMVGNKKDLFEKEKVDEEEAREYAEKIGARFGLTSAKDDPLSINLFLKDLLQDYINKYGEKGVNDSVIKNEKERVKIDKSKAKKEKKNCWC